RDAGQHDLVQDGETGVPGDLQGLLDDGVGQTVVLQVHLDGGDALLGTGHLEVHLAVEVLHALDVDEGGEGAVVVLNQAAGDAGHRGLDGHAGIHQGQGGAAEDRKSTRLNSSHVSISYAVFCLKKDTTGFI